MARSRACRDVSIIRSLWKSFLSGAAAPHELDSPVIRGSSGGHLSICACAAHSLLGSFGSLAYASCVHRTCWTCLSYEDEDDLCSSDEEDWAQCLELVPENCGSRSSMRAEVSLHVCHIRHKASQHWKRCKPLGCQGCVHRWKDDERVRERMVARGCDPNAIIRWDVEGESLAMALLIPCEQTKQFFGK